MFNGLVVMFVVVIGIIIRLVCSGVYFRFICRSSGMRNGILLLLMCVNRLLSILMEKFGMLNSVCGNSGLGMCFVCS